MANRDLRIQRLSGQSINPYLDHLARLRIEIFREWPYLYEGSLEYEQKYLQAFSRSPEAVVVLVSDGDEVVGASTGLPLEQAEAAFQQPFIQRGDDVDKIFYLAESVLRQPYRGLGLGVRFFEEREAFARGLGRFETLAFCAVERPADHPHRPADYVVLDHFWRKRGYVKSPDLKSYYAWPDLGETTDSLKPMVFWLKSLDNAP